ncbi:hypothetical protein L6452_09388 [Arctium lappa]|uniref:Uncharacterized protein n=1 Tax=Arctium lappa TaxID=4217 RepID=A0ACB9DKH2_ARCLA|nr:hypothetical protein L6452_09388 [Arctium lappa]
MPHSIVLFRGSNDSNKVGSVQISSSSNLPGGLSRTKSSMRYWSVIQVWFLSESRPIVDATFKMHGAREKLPLWLVLCRRLRRDFSHMESARSTMSAQVKRPGDLG